uniref:Uncharacterized protein n=1 Tax=Paramormyrops kingsleyae TaxID=1676925 RepID=A0A3B3RVF8_9TELE
MPDFETEASQHKAELISLDKTLKTTDITDSLADRGRHSPKRSPDGKKRKKKQRSELKVNIQGKEKDDLSPDNLTKSPLAPGISTSPRNLTASPTIARTPELSVSPDSKVGPKIISHTQLKEQQMAIDINTQSISGYQPTIKEDQKGAREEDISPFTGTGVAEDIKELKADVLISNVGVQKKPPKMDSGKQWKERSILISDLERYGIRSKGPVADIGIARSHYVSSVNEVQTSMIDRSDESAVKPTDCGLYENILDINRPRTSTATSTLHSEKTQKTEVSCKDDDVSTAPDGGIKESLLHIQPPLLTKDINKDISGQIEKQAPVKFKLPKMDKPDFSMHEPILKTDKEKTVTQLEIKDIKAELRDPTTEQIHIIESSHMNILPKREDIEIPGMEAVVPSRNIQMPGVRMTMDMQNIHDIKGQYSERDSASFKLPSADLSDIDLQQHITKTDINAEKVKLTKAASVSRPAEITEKPLDVKRTVPIQAPITDVRVPEFKIDSNYMIKEESKQSHPIFKLPRTEFPDADTHTPIAMTKIESSKITVESSGSKEEGYVQKAKVDAGEVTTIQTSVKQSFRSGETDATILKTKTEIGEISSTKRHSAIKLPKVKHPDLDIHQITKTDISTEKSGLQLESLPTVLKHDINVSLPNAAGSKMNLEAPKADTDVCGVLPEIEIKGTSLEATAVIPVSLTSVDVLLKKPDIDREVPKVSADVPSVDVKLPEAELTVSGQAPSVDVKGPRVEVEGRDVDGQGSNFKMPRFGISLSKVKATGPDIDVTLPKAKLDAQLPTAELLAPSVEGEVEITEKDVKGLDVKIKKPKISFPNIDFQETEVKAPEAEVTIAKGEISLPQASIEAKGSKLDRKFTDVDVKEDVAIGDLPSKSKVPTMKLPKFGATKGKVEGVDVSADINVPEAKVPSGEVAIEVKAPDTEGMGLEVDKTKGKFKLPKVTMPDMNVSLPKVSGPEINLKGPKMETDVSVSKPETDIKG